MDAGLARCEAEADEIDVLWLTCSWSARRAYPVWIIFFLASLADSSTMAGVDQGAKPWIIYDAPLSTFLLYPAEGAWDLVDAFVLKGGRDLARLMNNVVTFGCCSLENRKKVSDGFTDVYTEITDEAPPQPTQAEIDAYNEITSGGRAGPSQAEINARKFLKNLGLWDDPIPEPPAAGM